MFRCSPHEPLQLVRRIVPGEGSVEEQVEDDRVDGQQQEQLQDQFDR